jgi:hypothetical protein
VLIGTIKRVHTVSHFKVFFANRTADKQVVDTLFEKLTSSLPNYPIKNLSLQVPNNPTWEKDADKLIANCDAFICVIGSDTHSSEPIKWEIATAVRHKKYIAAIQLSDNNIVPDAIVQCGADVLTWTPDKVPAYLSSLLVEQALFPHSADRTKVLDPTIIWNQYNLAVQTWENLINRRQTVNTLYMSVCGGVLATIGALVSAADKAGAQAVASGACVFSVLGVLVCLNWKKTLKSYGALSAAKSQIVSALEQKMPARLFDAEWRVLEARKYVSTTQSDGQTATILTVLFSAIFAISLGGLVWQWLGPLLHRIVE